MLNTADSNTAVGTAALLLNTTGDEDVAVGTGALVYNDSGKDNAAVGAFALYNNIADPSTRPLAGTLSENITCTDNTAIGDAALAFNDVTGAGLANNNTAVGSVALTFNTDGDGNTAIGRSLTTPLARIIQLQVSQRSITTRTAAATPPSVLAHLGPTSVGLATRPWAFKLAPASTLLITLSVSAQTSQVRT